jgi:D-sedoheptulose 7-phosphate isomerase
MIKDLVIKSSDINDFKKSYLSLFSKTLEQLNNYDLEPIIQEFLDCRDRGGKIIFLGNGGSHANAQHFAMGVGYITKQWSRPIKTCVLGSSSSLVTSLANDYSFEEIFKLELNVIMNKEDLVVGLSVSGNSKNVISALAFAKDQNIRTFAFLGSNGGLLKNNHNHLLVSTEDLQLGVTEDIHMILGHLICYYIEYKLN